MTIKGFFSGKTAKQLIERNQVYGGSGGDPCTKCGLHKGVITSRMKAGGDGELGVLAIGEAPGKTEDEQGVQFIGEAGRLWQEYLTEYSIDIHRDFKLINAVNCRPPKNRAPTASEIQCCRGRVRAAIEEFNPKQIWLVGEAAIKSFYGHRFSECGVGRWHRLCIPDKQTNAWVVPMYHPSFALRANNDKNKLSCFERDLRFAVSCLDLEPPVIVDPVPMVDLITEYGQVVHYLKWLLERARNQKFLMAYDYECSNLKPFYGEAQYIWSCAISLGIENATAFPVSYTGHYTPQQEATILHLLKLIMEHPNIGKIAHNLQFEDLWSRGVLGANMAGWHWCTMNAAHVLDCRKDFCGLKFQSYINFGIEGYEQESKPYMRKTHKGTALNMLDTMPLDKLLLYNGLDSLLTMWLFNKQRPIFGRKGDARGRAFKKLTMPGLIALNDATVRGISMDEEHYREVEEELREKMDGLERKLTRGKVAKQFHQKTGKDLKIINKDFGAADLRVVLYDILDVKKIKETATGLKSVDREVVEAINHPWAKWLVEWRRLHKLLNTYFGQFTREISKLSKMHPNFPLHAARTYRGSSNSPNFQNFPNREEEARKAVREGILPRVGRRIAAADYGSQEVRVAAILSQDKRLMEYCMDEDSDMHMDVSTRIWAADPEVISKLIRFHSKGGFVFAEIYGSYYKNCALEMWEQCADLELNNGVRVVDHLKSQGVIDGSDDAKTKLKIRGKLQTVPRHLGQFVEHVYQVEKWFWEEFAGLREWQERMVSVYQKFGWVEMPFGYRRTGLLNNNKIFNTAVQGTAFHLLLWSYVQLNRYCKKHWKTELLGQIHDEILYDLEDSELQEVLNKTEEIMTVTIREAHPWVNVPLVIEPQVTEVDEPWYYKREMVKNTEGMWVFR